MTDYGILSYTGGYVISAKYKPTGQYLYMGRDGKWGSYGRSEDYFSDYGEALKKMEELMKGEKPKYEARVTTVIVNKTGEPIFSETATKIEIDDEGGGEFLKISQGDLGYIQITPEEWPFVRDQIEKMITECREEPKPSPVEKTIKLGGSSSYAPRDVTNF